MVYNWDVHEPKCYRLYIDEKKSLEEIMVIMRVEDNFTPSKRAYQTQFRRWNFPSKQNPAHKDDRLVARVKELWEKNLSQREMLRVLNEEDGYDLKHRELMRVRTRKRWLLRTPNPSNPVRVATRSTSPNKSPVLLNDDAVPLGQIEPSRYTQSYRPMHTGGGTDNDSSVKAKEWQDQPEEVVAKLDSRNQRRRHGRQSLGLQNASTVPPRFPSETTIDESRKMLGLDPKLYQHLRTLFAQICGEEAVIKKTTAGPERWEAAKGRLIQEVSHLQGVLWASGDDIEHRKLALDVICTDVTKRMRSLEQKLTIAEAKNLLRINPEEYRAIRQDFAAVVTGNRYLSKTEAGPEHWDLLKEKWRGKSEVLGKILSSGDVDPTYSDKLRAVDVVARDVMKRLRDNHSRPDSVKKRASVPMKPATEHAEAQAMPADETPGQPVGQSPSVDDDQLVPLDAQFTTPPSSAHQLSTSTSRVASISRSSTTEAEHSSLPSQREQQLQPMRPIMPQHQVLSTLPDNSVLSHSPSHHQTTLLPENVLSSGLPIDPQIDDSIPILLNGHAQPLETQHTHSPFPLTQDLPPSIAHSPHPYVQNPYANQASLRPSVAVYLRLHPSSPITVAPSIWIATLTARTFEELQQVAVKDFPGTACGRVEGILGADMTIEVSRDDELTAYLTVLEGRSSAPCFYVQILPGGWKTQTV